MLRRFLIPLVIIIALSSALAANAQQPNYFKLILITTNDLHANLVPFNHTQKLPDKTVKLKDVGGAARRAAFVNRVRAGSPGQVLLLDSGDTTFGVNPIAKAFHGAPDVEVMNAMGYLAMEPGNHDFQWQSPNTLRNIKSSHFPWICANLSDLRTGKPFLTPYIVRDYSGVRVAFFGLITPMVDLDAYKAARELGLRAINPIESASKLVPDIRRSADIVICLSHLGVELDKKLAHNVPGIDIILGGHSHTELLQPIMIPVSTPTATSLGAVPIVQAYEWGLEIGKTDVIFRRDETTNAYSLMSCRGELVPINNTLPDDPTIAQIICGYQNRMKPVVAGSQPN